MSRRVWWQVARIPVLLLLLAGIGQFQMDLAHAWQRLLEFGQAAVPWLATVLLGAAFVLVALVGRAAGVGRVLAGVEVVLAGVLALVPPPQWMLWFEVNWFTEWVGASIGNAFVQGLAVAWLVIAARALVAGGEASAGGPRDRSSVAHRQSAAR
ncbi:MAG: hypothetical protein R6T85_11455 [Egibacteraceae bacterium]